MDNGDKPSTPCVTTEIRTGPGSLDRPTVKRNHSGLTKREYFAGLAMQGLLATEINGPSIRDMADTAVTFADALLKALEE